MNMAIVLHASLASLRSRRYINRGIVKAYEVYAAFAVTMGGKIRVITGDATRRLEAHRR